MPSEADLRQKFLEGFGVPEADREEVWKNAKAMAAGGQITIAQAVGIALTDLRRGVNNAQNRHGSQARESGHDSRRSRPTPQRRVHHRDG